MNEPCITHDTPDGARFCIRCGVPIAATGRTERLDDDVLYMTRAECHALLREYELPIIYPYPGDETLAFYYGRRVIIRE